MARSPEGWWRGLEAEEGISSVFIDTTPIELIEKPLDPAERAAFFDTASAAFRDALAGAGLATPAVEPPEIRGQTYDRPLTVAMAVFLSARGIVLNDRISVLERIFMEERKHWRRLLGVDADHDPVVEVLSPRCSPPRSRWFRAQRVKGRRLIAADPRALAYGLPAQEETLRRLARHYGTRELALVRPIEPDLLGQHSSRSQPLR